MTACIDLQDVRLELSIRAGIARKYGLTAFVSGRVASYAISRAC